MSFEVFTNLREIDSLTKMKTDLMKKKFNQEDRVSKLNMKRQETEARSIELHEALKNFKIELTGLEKSLAVLAEQRQRIENSGGDEQKIQRYTFDISKLEEIGFEILSGIEESENELSEIQRFQEGLDKTIEEIKAEVDLEITCIDSEIRQLDLRISLLHEVLPENIKSLIDKLLSKNLILGPFTKIDQGSCFFCRFKISRLEESEIDIQKSVKTCQQCSRIFLPYGV